MHAYVLSPNEQCPSTMLPDLAAVKEKIRAMPKDSRTFALITLEDFPNDKKSFIAACNGQPPAARQVLKKWRIGGSRGGRLIEIPVESDE